MSATCQRAPSEGLLYAGAAPSAPVGRTYASEWSSKSLNEGMVAPPPGRTAGCDSRGPGWRSDRSAQSRHGRSDRSAQSRRGRSDRSAQSRRGRSDRNAQLRRGQSDRSAQSRRGRSDRSAQSCVVSLFGLGRAADLRHHGVKYAKLQTAPHADASYGVVIRIVGFNNNSKHVRLVPKQELIGRLYLPMSQKSAHQFTCKPYYSYHKELEGQSQNEIIHDCNKRVGMR
eukprot:1386097-Pyramimonas_sp.AAC.2